MSKAPVHSRVLLRAIVALAVGFVVGACLWVLLDPWAGVLGGWGVTAGIAAGWILVVVWPMDAADTKSHATAEDPGRRTARIISVAASTASLVAVAAVLIQVRHAPPVESWILAGIALVAVAASWTLIQTDYMLRIAAIYYRDPVGGIDFNQADDPMYTDFAYISFGLGMAYQVADTNLRTNELRRIVLFQMLISYAFGAIILATVINLVSGLG
ncbi:DUF1345 domain-containing protein [Microbacterium sp. B2969]|uniref:DUF1345 domain-containing protein n=1 Tax=Microbacterium alkaliflavum TaxID=3248839 RepID=A0ABW7Q6F9_9MICO